jgi:hypothetical protein
LLLNIVAGEKGKTEKACSPFSSAAKDRETGKGSYTYYSSSMEKQNSYRMLQHSALSSVCMLCSAAHLGKEIHQLALQEEFKFLSEENDIARDLANRGGHTSSFILNMCTSSKVSGFLATVPTAQSSKVVFKFALLSAGNPKTGPFNSMVFPLFSLPCFFVVFCSIDPYIVVPPVAEARSRGAILHHSHAPDRS